MPSPRASLLFVLLLLMELLPGFVLLVGTSLLEATTWGYALFWLLVVVALMGAAFGLFVYARHWRRRRHRSTVVLGGAIAAGVPSLVIANGVETFLASFILLAIAFWRGLVVTAEAPSHDEVQRRFAYGFGVLFFGILWVIARGIIVDRQIWQMLAAAGISFIVVSMLALVTARIAQNRDSGAGGAIALAAFVQLGGLLLLSLVGLQLFALDLAGLVGHTIQPFFDALGRDLSNLLGYIADPVDRFIQLIRPHGKPATPLSPPAAPVDNFNGKRPKYHRPFQSPLVAIVALVIVIAIAAGIGYAIWRAVPRAGMRPVTKRAFSEERRTLISMSSLWRSLLASFLAFFTRGTHATAGVLSTARRRVWGPDYPSNPIRRTYAQVLRRAESLGLGMPSTSTPLEFQARLGDRWPEVLGEFDLITAAYVRCRYGDLPSTDDEVASLRAAWQRLRPVMKGPSMVAVAWENRRVALASALKAPEHERPERPYPRDERASQWTEAERMPWRPTGATLLLLSLALPALVIICFLVILGIASGRLG